MEEGGQPYLLLFVFLFANLLVVLVNVLFEERVCLQNGFDIVLEAYLLLCILGGLLVYFLGDLPIEELFATGTLLIDFVKRLVDLLFVQN